MATTTSKSAFWRGFRGGLPFLLVIAPFALLFGVVSAEAGLNLAQTMGMSVLVIAGASQFTAVQLMSENAPAIIVLATALAVNLRLAMYSASLVPHLGHAKLWQRAIAAYFLIDQSYAVCFEEYERRPGTPMREKLIFFAGCILPICSVWYLLTYVGATVGSQIPPEFALDFALPITFLAMIAPMLRTVPHVVAAATSILGALALAWMPFGSGLLVAALAAMIAGAVTETWMERRA
jgi:predicted branched-subunit amino acid permease